MTGTEEENAKQKEGPTPEQKRSHTHGRAKMQWEKMENETGGKDVSYLNCLIYKAHRVEGESETDEKYPASATPEYPLPKVLEDAGYTCTNDEMFALLERELDPALRHREETRENREKG